MTTAVAPRMFVLLFLARCPLLSSVKHLEAISLAEELAAVGEDVRREAEARAPHAGKPLGFGEVDVDGAVATWPPPEAQASAVAAVASVRPARSLLQQDRSQWPSWLSGRKPPTWMTRLAGSSWQCGSFRCDFLVVGNKLLVDFTELVPQHFPVAHVENAELRHNRASARHSSPISFELTAKGGKFAFTFFDDGGHADFDFAQEPLSDVWLQVRKRKNGNPRSSETPICGAFKVESR